MKWEHEENNTHGPVYECYYGEYIYLKVFSNSLGDWAFDVLVHNHEKLYNFDLCDRFWYKSAHSAKMAATKLAKKLETIL